MRTQAAFLRSRGRGGTIQRRRWKKMRKNIPTAAAILGVLALVTTGLASAASAADEAPVVRHTKKVKRVCVGPECGPYAPCGARCRPVCPDGYSCYPLYGAYGPYGGVGYWGSYTLSGWGPRW